MSTNANMCFQKMTLSLLLKLDRIILFRLNALALLQPFFLLNLYPLPPTLFFCGICTNLDILVALVFLFLPRPLRGYIRL